MGQSPLMNLSRITIACGIGAIASMRYSTFKSLSPESQTRFRFTSLTFLILGLYFFYQDQSKPKTLCLSGERFSQTPELSFNNLNTVRHSGDFTLEGTSGNHALLLQQHHVLKGLQLEQRIETQRWMFTFLENQELTKLQENWNKWRFDDLLTPIAWAGDKITFKHVPSGGTYTATYLPLELKYMFT